MAGRLQGSVRSGGSGGASTNHLPTPPLDILRCALPFHEPSSAASPPFPFRRNLLADPIPMPILRSPSPSHPAPIHPQPIGRPRSSRQFRCPKRERGGPFFLFGRPVRQVATARLVGLTPQFDVPYRTCIWTRQGTAHLFSAPSAHRPGAEVSATGRVVLKTARATRACSLPAMRMRWIFFKPLMVPCRSVPFWVLHSCTVAQLRLHLLRSIHVSEHWFMHFIS